MLNLEPVAESAVHAGDGEPHLGLAQFEQDLQLGQAEPLVVHKLVRPAADNTMEMTLDLFEDVGRHVHAPFRLQAIEQMCVAEPARDVDRAFASGGP